MSHATHTTSLVTSTFTSSLCSASSQLETYKRDLASTRQQLSVASEELSRQGGQQLRPLTEDERREMRTELSAKIDKVQTHWSCCYYFAYTDVIALNRCAICEI